MFRRRRLIRSVFAGAMAGQTYAQKVQSLFGSSLIRYWPLDDAVGAAAAREMVVGGTGAPTAVTFGQPGLGGDAGTSASFDGSTSYINLYSAALAAAFNNQEGAIILSLKVSGSGVWADGTNRYPLRIAADNNNSIEINKGSAANQVRLFYIAGGTSKQVAITTSSTGFLRIALSWSKANDQLMGFLNGVQQSTTQTGLGVWSGALSNTRTLLGAFITTPTNGHSGYLAHVLLLNRPITNAEAAADYALLPNP